MGGAGMEVFPPKPRDADSKRASVLVSDSTWLASVSFTLSKWRFSAMRATVQ